MKHDQKVWNRGQKEFRRALLSFEEHEKALGLFMVLFSSTALSISPIEHREKTFQSFVA